MKPRRVMLTLEVDTDAPLPWLRRAGAYVALVLTDGKGDGWTAAVEQAQANVHRPKKAPQRGKRP